MVMLDVYGAKGGSSNAHTPVEQDDSAQSIARCRMLLALGEGEFAGGLDATRIFLDGTPLGNDDGTFNFANVSWDFRPGTQTQTPIPGFPSVSSETQINVELFKATPYVRNLTNTQIDAVVVRIGIPQLQYQTDDGDVVGTSVSYQIQVATDGGSYETMLDKTVSEKLSSLYELSHRINLPRASTGWRLRVVRLTDDSTSQRLLNRTQIQAVTEVIDANLRYPHTALLYVSFDAKSFNNIPKISCKVKGRIIRVPSNYDPINRTYSGTWDGVFKWAWSNNPAWVWFDVLTEPRFGLGRRVTPAMLDKWELYRIAQRCDQLVPDGNGGTGTEPRFLFDCYIQSQAEAWTVIKDISAGFNGLTFWGNNMFQTVADMPVDEKSVQIVTRASIVGKPVYTSGSAKDRISSALVNFSDATNHYQDKTAGVMLPNFLQQSGFKQGSFSAIGCVRESEAQRRGSYIIYSNQLDRQTSFTVGLEGYAYLPGTVVYLADERVSGRVYGGRVVEYSSSIRAVKTDRETSAVVGDVLFVRTIGGITERRTVTQVNGDQIIINTPFGAPIEPNAVFVIDAGQLKLQQMRVVDLKFNDGENTYTITGLEYNTSKYDAVDYNAILDKPPISLIPTGIVSQPRNVSVTSFDSVVQGQRVASMLATWDVPLDKDGNPQSDIIGYDVQWKRNDNNWVNVPRTGLRSVQIDGVYAGSYLLRVRAIGSMGASSLWVSSDLTSVQGRTGEVPTPLNLTASIDQAFAVELMWAFGADSGDGAYTEIQYSYENDTDKMQLLSAVPYPQHNYLQSGLKAGVQFFYRARLADRLGNTSAWTSVVSGSSSTDVTAIAELVLEQIKDTELFKDLIENAVESSEKLKELADAITDNADRLALVVGSNKQTAEAIINNALAIADVVVRQTAQNGENSAKFEQLREVIATETEARVTDVTRLEAKTSDNAADITEVRQALATETEARATAVDQLSAKTDKNEADVTDLTQAVTTLDSAMSSRLEELSAKTDNASGGVQNNAIALINNTLAQVNLRTTLTAQYGDSKAGIERVDNVMVDASSAVAESLKKLDANAASGGANATDFAKTMADFSQASATRINSLSVTVNGQQAAIDVNAKATADINGNINAMYNIKVGVDSNGRQYAAGMGIGVQNTPAGMQSQVIFIADRLAVMSQAGGAVSLPFVIQNGQTFIQDAFIRDGSITNAKIANASINMAKISGALQSDNWDGFNGWYLPKNGGFQIGGSGTQGRTQIDGSGVAIYTPQGVLVAKLGWF